MKAGTRPFAIVTSASAGIGFELAKCCAAAGYDLLIAADEVEIHDAAVKLRRFGGTVQVLEGDLSTLEGVTQLLTRVGARPVDALLVNAGRGPGSAFLDQDFNDVLRVIDTNVTGTLLLVQRIGRAMRAAKQGQILITGPLGSSMPGYQAVYNGTKALLDSFATALRTELQDSGVTVTCLMPRASDKQAPDELARLGFEAMLQGEGTVTKGLPNKLRGLTSKHSSGMALKLASALRVIEQR